VNVSRAEPEVSAWLAAFMRFSVNKGQRQTEGQVIVKNSVLDPRVKYE